EGGVRRLGRDRDETAATCLQAVREEDQSEEELLLARRSLEDHARAHRQTALDHRVESFDARLEPFHRLRPPVVGSGRRRTTGCGGSPTAERPIDSCEGETGRAHGRPLCRTRRSRRYALRTGMVWPL